MATITFNGKVYNSLEEMPPEARQAYEQAMSILADRNQNGVPDILESFLPLGSGPVQIVSSSQIIVNGQTYASPDQMPPEARQAYEKFADAFDKNRNGILDFFEDALSPDMVPQDHVAPPAGMPASQPGRSQPAGSLPAPGTEAPANRLRLAGAIVGLILLAAAAVLLVIFAGPMLFGAR